MGHEHLQAGPDPCVLHPIGQDIIEYDRALWNPLMLQRGMSKQSTVYNKDLIKIIHIFSFETRQRQR